MKKLNFLIVLFAAIGALSFTDPEDGVVIIDGPVSTSDCETECKSGFFPVRCKIYESDMNGPFVTCRIHTVPKKDDETIQ